jgi:hypothetical protein
VTRVDESSQNTNIQTVIICLLSSFLILFAIPQQQGSPMSPHSSEQTSMKFAFTIVDKYFSSTFIRIRKFIKLFVILESSDNRKDEEMVKGNINERMMVTSNRLVLVLESMA